VTLLAQARDASRQMHAALREADAAALKLAAHGVKGAALNLGLRALAEAADRIHQQADRLEATPLALALQRYDETLAATRDLCTTLAMIEPER
jgi:HPt (histidine-containing phosphotransfer) domain-containing protein